MKNVIISTIKSWNISNAVKFQELYKDKYKIFVFTQKNELNYEIIKDIKPEYIFFPHWSWIIPEKIYRNFECVVFHMTDLPYGRGGSPLQNLIINKIYNTKISAIKVKQGLDTGEIYLKEDFNIALGSAEEIFQKLSEIIFFKLIPYILENNPVTYKQTGEIVTFNRRKPEESNIINANLLKLEDLYDFIRMLDAEGYPKAYIKTGKFKIELFEAHKKSDKLIGRFEVSEE